MSRAPLLESIHRRRLARWCLFLDRDGVINTRIMDGYVRDWSEFHFEPGALDALAELARWAPRIVVVTNQQGVGKGLMSTADLDDIHRRMRAEIEASGGRIDAVQVCPHLASADCNCRKPRPGMPLAELAAHPELDGSLSVMVGDTESDVEMGHRLADHTAGCVVIRIAEDDDPLADLTFAGLDALARAVRSARETDAHSAE